MPEITGADTFFTNIDSAFTATKWEACIDQAIDKINGYARDDILPNMGGTAGSKTVSLTSTQAGWVRSIAVAVYASTKTAGASSSSIGLGAMTQSSSLSIGSNMDSADELAQEAARNLRDLEVSYG